MCVFVLEKSTERLKKTHKKLGVTGNRTLIFVDLVGEQTHLLTCDQAPSSLFVWETRKKNAWSQVSSLVRVREHVRRIGRETRTSVPTRRLAMSGHNAVSHRAKLALILQEVDSATLAMYESVSSDIAIGFPNAYSLDRDWCGEYPNPNFEYSWGLKRSSF